MEDSERQNKICLNKSKNTFGEVLTLELLEKGPVIELKINKNHVIKNVATELGKTKTMKLSGRIQSKVFAVRGLIRYVIHRQRGGVEGSVRS